MLPLCYGAGMGKDITSPPKLAADPLLEAARKPHLLVVDDDERLRQLLSRYLSEQGFLVTTAASAGEARGILQHLVYDLIVLDVMMPGEDGLSLTRGLKAQGEQTPVMLLTALGEVEARIEGLEAGADDYLPKPFEPRELLLRVQSILRRQGNRPAVTREDDANATIGPWTFDRQKGELFATDGTRTPLTQAESTLLKALISRQGVTVSREELAELCDMSAAERTIDVQITRLRRKVETDPKQPRHIQTVRGKGYVLWPK